MPRGIFYRGDFRVYGRIFDAGFKSDPQGANFFRFSTDDAGKPKTNMAFDVNPRELVCITKDFFAASIFPADGSARTYIYAMDLDVLDMVNTQQAQLTYVQSIAHQLTPPEFAEALWPMFGQERAMTSIDTKDIICAIEVTRRYNGTNFLAGGQFTVVRCIENEDYQSYNRSTFDKVVGAMKGFVGKTFEMPVQAQGIVQSTKT